MIKLENVEYHSRYRECYESVLITILKYMGLPDETPWMGTQAYFVLGPGTVSSRFNRVDQEWAQEYGLQVHSLSATDAQELKDKIVAKLEARLPVCLPVDIYVLPHTPHYKYIHQRHYVAIFGYDERRYYLVCPYYRFMGWVDMAMIHDGFFSPVVGVDCLKFIPELKTKTLSAERVQSLVEANCRYMLGLDVPETLTEADPCYLGLAGMRTLADLLQEGEQSLSLPPAELIGLSNQLKGMGVSRYWFCKLLMDYEESLLPEELAGALQRQFEEIVKLWELVGKRLGAGIHGHNPALIGQAVHSLEQAYEKETRLFNALYGALPGNETGQL